MTPRISLIPILVLAACSDRPAPTPDAPDPDPDAPPAECTELEVPATIVTELHVDQDAPAFLGGTVVPGSYLLTAATIYTGPGGRTAPTGRTLRAVTVNDGATYEFVQFETIGSQTNTQRQAGAYSFAGTTTSIENDCPGGDTAVFDYNATATEFTLYGDHPLGTSSITFTRQ